MRRGKSRFGWKKKSEGNSIWSRMRMCKARSEQKYKKSWRKREEPTTAATKRNKQLLMT